MKRTPALSSTISAVADYIVYRVAGDRELYRVAETVAVCYSLWHLETGLADGSVWPELVRLPYKFFTALVEGMFFEGILI